MKNSAFVFLFTSMVAAAPALAVNGYIAEIGGGDDVQSLRIGMARHWEQQWLTEGHWHLTGYWEVSLGYLESNRVNGKSVADLTFTPVFRFRPNASGGTQPYWDVALGLHLLTNTRIDHRHDLGSAVQFSPMVGFGVTFGEKSQYDLGYRFQHLTNLDINEANDHLNLHQIRLTYLY